MCCSDFVLVFDWMSQILAKYAAVAQTTAEEKATRIKLRPLHNKRQPNNVKQLLITKIRKINEKSSKIMKYKQKRSKRDFGGILVQLLPQMRDLVLKMVPQEDAKIVFENVCLHLLAPPRIPKSAQIP